MTEMVRCGVNLVGFDQLHAGDERLPSLVWSWRVDEPAADATSACAALGEDGRLFADDCATPRPIACRTAAGGWAVTAEAAPWASGDTACQTAGHAGAGVPANGWDSGLLRAEADAAGAPEVWLAYGQDAEFYGFYRSLEAYRNSLADGRTTLVLDPDSEFLRYFGRDNR